MSDLIKEVFARAVKAKQCAGEWQWHTRISQWSLEQRILNRDGGESEQDAAIDWLESTISNGILEDDRGVVKFMEDNKI